MEPVIEIVQENPELAEAVQELMEGALARSTMNTYQGAVTRYQEFCESGGYDRSAVVGKVKVKKLLRYVTSYFLSN